MSPINQLNNGQLWLLVNMCRSQFRRSMNARIKLYHRGKVFVPPVGKVDVPLHKMRTLINIEKILVGEMNTRPPDRPGATPRRSKPILGMVPIPDQVDGKPFNLQEAIDAIRVHPLWTSLDEEEAVAQ